VSEGSLREGVTELSGSAWDRFRLRDFLDSEGASG